MQLTGEILIIVAIVGVALAFLGRRVWRALGSTRAKGAKGCDTGCGCDSAGDPRSRDWAER